MEYNFLVLEDDPERIEQFRKRFNEFAERRAAVVNSTFTEEVGECLRLLRTKRFDLVFFDHDLGGQQMVSCDSPNTGSEVARQMIQEGLVGRHGGYIVHSFNPYGAAYMSELIGCPRVPSVWTKALFHSTVQ